ncbi:tyrosine phosphatase family protein [Roseibium salinum]|uniref:Tyrosine phosphatase family protein n=1 Tax=Roseibium salinum TaxID=1604349 RepID=A0ABT3R3N6_9HYPH|nr:tyrosine phosphatase family protein [Roseibium sp. DSM 29163]MCX2723745.1 tyrosine phosphatase family protein [Roseibium sp. DSM 29163]
MLHVCSLSRLPETVTATGAKSLVTLINAEMEVPTPVGIAPDRHLNLAFNDIVDPVGGLIAVSERHIDDLIGFIRTWDREAPLVIHCWAGISRSTAGAYVAACTLNPEADEYRLAAILRRQSPSATPNARIVAMADRHLGRDGRMIDAIRGIGRGANAFEGTPFVMPLD